MTRTEFISSLEEDNPPPDLSQTTLALWYDGKGNWQMAHQIAQDIPGSSGSLIHAYLHRKEGDQGNASYWYRQANRPKPDVGLQDEWDKLVDEFL